MTEWQHGNIRLLCADCMDVMRECDGVLAELAVCGPDYGLNKKISQGGGYAVKYKGFDGNLGGRPNKAWFEELRRVSVNQVVWGGNYFDFLPPTRCFLVWEKKDRNHTFADCEYAWTSFDKNARSIALARNPHGISGVGKRIHVAQKPVQLYMWIYDLLANPDDRILDTHMGSGSSVIAAYETNHPYVGIEINPEYFANAVARIEKHIQEHPKLL